MTNKQKIEELRKVSYELLELRDRAVASNPDSKLVEFLSNMTDRVIAARTERIALLQLKDPDAQLDYVVPMWSKLFIVASLAYLAYKQVYL